MSHFVGRFFSNLLNFYLFVVFFIFFFVHHYFAFCYNAYTFYSLFFFILYYFAFCYYDFIFPLGDPDLAPGILTNSLGANENILPKNIIWEVPGQVSSLTADISQPVINIANINSDIIEQNIPSQTGQNNINNNVNFGDEFSQLIATLPHALRNLDPQFLQLIVQNEDNVAFILDSNGEVDQNRIELLRSRLLPNMNDLGNNIGRERERGRERGRGDMGGDYDQSNAHYRGNNGGNNGINGFTPYVPPPQYNGDRINVDSGSNLGLLQGQGHGQENYSRDTNRQHHNGPGARKRSRFSDREITTPPQGPGPGFQDLSQQSLPYHNHTVDLQPYVPTEMHQINPMDRHLQDNYDRERDNDNLGMERSRSRGEAEQKFPTTKSAVSCRFFNTRKGCQFGDKCPFGHFMEETPPPVENRKYGSGSGPSSSNNGSGRDGFYGSGTRGSGQGGSRSSPGGKRNDRQDRGSDRGNRR